MVVAVGKELAPAVQSLAGKIDLVGQRELARCIYCKKLKQQEG